ncbi:1982_t:CDS:1, partial [Dentiscutata heterogama]
SSSPFERQRFYCYISEIIELFNDIKCLYIKTRKGAKGCWKITRKYEYNMNDEQLTTWKIDKEANKLIYKNYYEKPVSCVNMRDYLGSHLLPNDDLIVIATNCIAIYTLIKNEIRIVYYINIDIFMNIQRSLKDELQILAHQEPFKSKNLWDAKYFKHVLDYIDEESEKNVAQSLRNMITLYIDDIYTLSCCSPYIMESI